MPDVLDEAAEYGRRNRRTAVLSAEERALNDAYSTPVHARAVTAAAAALWGIDYAWGGPPISQIRGAYQVVLRYASSTDPNRPRGKDLTKAELVALHAAGVAVGSVWETTATEARGGWQAGVRAGRLHNARLDVLGFPKSTPAYYAVDEDPPDLNAVVAYFAGAAAQGRQAGPYGGIRTIDVVCGSGKPNVASRGWQAVAWSGGRLSRHAALLQLVARPVPGISGDHDDNRILDLSAVAAWFPGTQPAPPQEEDPMFDAHALKLLESTAATVDDLAATVGRLEARAPRQVVRSSGAVYSVTPVERRWIQTEEVRLHLAAAYRWGAPEKWADADIDAVPLVGPEAPGVPVAH